MTPKPIRRGRGRPRKYTTHLSELAKLTIYIASVIDPPPTPNYEALRRKELNRLLDQGVFRITKKSDIPEGTRIFRSRFVDYIKFQGTEKAFKKSRLVVQAYNDSGKLHVLTQAPTIIRAS